MKRSHLGMMTLLALVLGACGNGQTKDSKTETTQVTQGATTAEVTTQTTTTVAPKPDNKELYARVFEDIRTVKELGADVAGKLNVPLQYWAANSLNKQKDSLQYLFYDINEDGVDELFIGHTANGQPFTVVAYYLDGKTPKIPIKVMLLKQGEQEVPLVSSKADCSTRLNSCLEQEMERLKYSNWSQKVQV